MPELNGWLDARARAATVHLLPHEEPSDERGAAGVPMWGSGFFVAPGLVLTAAHVLLPYLAADRSAVFAVRGGTEVNAGIPVPARLERWLVDGRSPGRAPSTGEDLALVRLLDDTVEHECVWLADRAVQHVGVLRGYGYRPDQEDGRPCAVPWSGDTEINVRDSAYGLRFKPDIEFPDGVSGGPLLDPETGAVVALIKARRGVRDGGLAVSVLAMRRFGAVYGDVVRGHDTWHGTVRGRDTWIDAQQAAFARGRDTHGGEWTPRDRRAALRRLAALPPPPDGPTVEALARQAISGNHWPQPQESSLKLHAWRDGHGLLYEGSRPLDAMIMLRYLRLVALYVQSRGGEVDALTDWIGDRLGEHSWSNMAAFVTDARLPDLLLPDPDDTVRTVIPYPGPGEGTTVAVLLDPVIGSEPTHFFWQIWIDDGGGEPALYATDQSVHGHRPGDLVRALSAPLTDVFQTRDRKDRPVPLEIALPAEHFDTAVHRWRLDDIAELDAYHLGAQRRVVLRALERRGEPDNVWAARWRAMVAQRQLTGWRVPEPGVSPNVRQFREAAHSTVPVICRSVSRGLGRTAMRLALESGHGVVLWRVDGHVGGGCADSCDDLHARTKWLFERIESVTELPDRLRQLRQEIAAQRADRRWAEPLALLYDDPRRPLPAEDTTPVDAP